MIYERNRPQGCPIENVKVDESTRRLHQLSQKQGFIQINAISKLQNDVMLRKQKKMLGDKEKSDLTKYDFSEGRMKQ